MDKSELLEAKIEELNASLEAVMANPNLSENTKRTQKFQRTKEIRTLILMKALIDESGFSVEMEKWFTSLVTLTSERRTATTVEVKEGDNLISLLQKYKEVSNIYEKITKAVDKAGLRLVDGVVTK